MQLLTIYQVEEKVGFKRSTVYKKISAGEFPPPVKIGQSARWLDEAVDKWIAETASAYNAMVC